MAPRITRDLEEAEIDVSKMNLDATVMMQELATCNLQNYA